MPRKSQKGPVPVIDLFAGPGGLSEGFASVVDERLGPRFRIALSIEKDAVAHRTLKLRAFARQFPHKELPEEYYSLLRQEITEEELFESRPIEAAAATEESWCAELGKTRHDQVRERIRSLIGEQKSRPWVLIGGPPCQAYSLAGRSRNRGVKGYRLEKDERHNLYEEYLRIIAAHWPPVFVMENVKGLLSTTVRDEHLFERILSDLGDPGKALRRSADFTYAIHAIEPNNEGELFEGDSHGRFVVRAEKHGIPQRRHRLILLGVRNDLGPIVPSALSEAEEIPARRVLKGLPSLRSGLSGDRGLFRDNGVDGHAWRSLFTFALDSRWVQGNAGIDERDRISTLVRKTMKRMPLPKAGRGGDFVPGEVTIEYKPRWFLDGRIEGACNHSSREHMESDLFRYMFAACFANVNHRSPRLRDFPPDLLPAHENVHLAMNGGYFNDRFRVQLWDRPATTITSHIHKDGHYYIHPDPKQCRSLTVREAARIQTFPDNYFFTGPRSEQYAQVGNAVPPLLARQIAEIVIDVLERSAMVG